MSIGAAPLKNGSVDVRQYRFEPPRRSAALPLLWQGGENFHNLDRSAIEQDRHGLHHARFAEKYSQGGDDDIGSYLPGFPIIWRWTSRMERKLRSDIACNSSRCARLA